MRSLPMINQPVQPTNAVIVHYRQSDACRWEWLADAEAAEADDAVLAAVVPCAVRPGFCLHHPERLLAAPACIMRKLIEFRSPVRSRIG